VAGVERRTDPIRGGLARSDGPGEQGRDSERTRADALRDRLAAAEAAAEQARTQADAARDRAEAAERADTARRTAGLLRRFRAAWRGD
jgi:hypothetical protein